MSFKISQSQARQLVLKQQGLLGEFPFGKGRDGIFKTIQQLGYIQIDTISVVERAQHHTLWLRCPDYQKDNLLHLQEHDKQIFEYWSHAAAYLPMENYRFALPRMNSVKKLDNHWFKKEPKVMKYVKDRITAEGPLMSKDFKPPKGKKASGWWDWKPAKKALELLFHEGELMVAVRRNFQKVYDLRERVLPKGIDTSVPSLEEYVKHLALQTIQAQGFARASEMTYLRKGLKSILPKVLNELLENEEIVEIDVHGNKNKYYSTKLLINNLDKVTSSKKVRFLNPFDNAIIQRQRVRDLFGFDYKLECYVPAAKRIYGYYSLAVLFGDDFVAHLDVKADRKTGVLQQKSLTFKEKYKPTSCPVSANFKFQHVES